MEKATTNSLRWEAEELGLRAGRKVDVIDSIDGEENERRRKHLIIFMMQDDGIDGEENERRRKRSGVVVRLFRHFFQCDMGGYKECFRYNSLLRTEMGEKVRLRGF